jgi:hypothetical protein
MPSLANNWARKIQFMPSRANNGARKIQFMPSRANNGARKIQFMPSRANNGARKIQFTVSRANNWVLQNSTRTFAREQLGVVTSDLRLRARRISGFKIEEDEKTRLIYVVCIFRNSHFTRVCGPSPKKSNLDLKKNANLFAQSKIPLYIRGVKIIVNF